MFNLRKETEVLRFKKINIPDRVWGRIKTNDEFWWPGFNGKKDRSFSQRFQSLCSAFLQPTSVQWSHVDIHLFPLCSSVEALRCVKCHSEESCANPEETCTGGKCYTYHTADREGDAGIFTVVEKGCYPEGQDSTSLCSPHCEPCRNFRAMIEEETDRWICEHHCCDDYDECNRHLYAAPTCHARGMLDL